MSKDQSDGVAATSTLSLFMGAIAKGDEAKAISLIRAGLDPNAHMAADSEFLPGSPLIFAAIMAELWDISLSLIEAGANTEGLYRYGIQDLTLTRIMDRMLEGSDKPEPPQLDVAMKVRKALLKASRHHRNLPEGESLDERLAHVSPSENRWAEILLLIEAGANPNTPDRYTGWTPLHEAAYYFRSEVVSSLLALGSKVNAATTYGKTPLHLASRNPSRGKKVIEILLNAGANPSARDHEGKTPLDMAPEPSRSDLAEMLR